MHLARGRGGARGGASKDIYGGVGGVDALLKARGGRKERERGAEK